MNKELIEYMFTVSRNIAKRNAEGITNNESLQEMQGGTSVNWIVGHILQARNTLLTQLGCEVVIPDNELMFYRPAHDEPIRQGTPIPLDTLLEKLDNSHPRFLELVTQTVTLADSTTTEQQQKLISFFHFHESYHVGQLGVMRRVLGKEGKIA